MKAKDFDRRMREIGDGIVTNSADAQVKVARAALRRLVDTTPADEGTAISNWQVGINRALSSVRRAYSKGSKGSTRRANAEAAYAAGNEKLNKFKQGFISISNNLPYINRLNNGWSKQAPVNFVESAFIAASKALKGVKLISKRARSNG